MRRKAAQEVAFCSGISDTPPRGFEPIVSPSQSTANPCFITLRLANVGSLSINSISVTLRRDSTTGPILTTLSNAQVIPAGAFHDISWTWQNPPVSNTSVELYAIADEANAMTELDETNNTAHVTASLLRVGDLNNDGSASLADLNLFVAVLLSLDTDPYHMAAADMDGSGTANGIDIQLFVNALVGG